MGITSRFRCNGWSLYLSVNSLMTFSDAFCWMKICNIQLVFDWCLFRMVQSHRPGDKPLSEPMMVSLLTYIWVIWPQWVNSMVNEEWTRCKFEFVMQNRLKWKIMNVPVKYHGLNITRYAIQREVVCIFEHYCQLTFQFWHSAAHLIYNNRKFCSRSILVYQEHNLLHDVIIKGNISALLVFCEGNSLVISEFPSQWLMTRRFDVFFVLCLNKRLSKE